MGEKEIQCQPCLKSLRGEEEADSQRGRRIEGGLFAKETLAGLQGSVRRRLLSFGRLTREGTFCETEQAVAITVEGVANTYLSKAKHIPCSLLNPHRGNYYLDVSGIKRLELWEAMTYPRLFSKWHSQDWNSDVFCF